MRLALRSKFSRWSSSSIFGRYCTKSFSIPDQQLETDESPISVRYQRGSAQDCIKNQRFFVCIDKKSYDGSTSAMIWQGMIQVETQMQRILLRSERLLAQYIPVSCDPTILSRERISLWRLLCVDRRLQMTEVFTAQALCIL